MDSKSRRSMIFIALFAFSRIDSTNLDLLMEIMKTFGSKQLTNNNVITQDIPCFYFFLCYKAEIRLVYTLLLHPPATSFIYFLVMNWVSPPLVGLWARPRIIRWFIRSPVAICSDKLQLSLSLTAPVHILALVRSVQ